MRVAVAMLAALLSGCVTTPEQVVERGQRHEYLRTAQPKLLAQCATLNARNFSGKYTAAMSEMVRPRSYQIVVTEPLRRDTPIIVAHAAPAVEGSQLLLYFSDELSPPLTADWIERLMQGC